LTVWLGAGVADKVALAVEADDEHGTSVAVAFGLVGGEFGRLAVAGRDLAYAFAEAAVAELVGAPEVVDRVVGIVGGDHGFHGAVMAVAEGQDVRPHRSECNRAIAQGRS